MKNPIRIALVCMAVLCLSGLLVPQVDASCTAQWTCAYPYFPETISCGGRGTCESGPDYVMCDGIRTDCTYCPKYYGCIATCDGEFDLCLDLCNDSYIEKPTPCVEQCLNSRYFCYQYCEAGCF